MRGAWLGLAVGTILLGAGCSSGARWQTFDPGTNSYTAEFPGKPVCQTLNTNHLCMFQWGTLRFTVMATPRIKGPPRTRVPAGRTEVPLGPHRAIRGPTTDGDPPSGGERIDVDTEKFMIVADVMWVGGSSLEEAQKNYQARKADADRFLGSLRILDAPLPATP